MSVIDSVKDYMKDRTTNPLFGSFLVSWLVVNWRVVVLLVSAESPAAKYWMFEHYTWDQFPKGGWYSLGLPALVAVLYTFAWPKAERRIYVYLRTQSNLRRAAEIKADGETPIDQLEAKELQYSIRSLQAQVEEKEDDLRAARRETAAVREKHLGMSAAYDDAREKVALLERQVENERRIAQTQGMLGVHTALMLRSLYQQEGGLTRAALRAASGLTIDQINETVERFPSYFTLTLNSGSPPQDERIRLSPAGSMLTEALLR